MKKVIVFCGLFLIGLTSCKKEVEAKPEPEPAVKVATENSVVEECYLAVVKKDSFSMHLKIVDNKEVSGKLIYDFDEKDRNEGDLSGIIKGDTLIANYTFMSEGISSMREVIFLKKDINYIEGHGEIIDDNNGKVVFKDLKQIKFDDAVVLSKTACKP